MSSKTMMAYRIVAPRRAESAFSGEGARKFGGRWNSPGRSIVYLSESRALCALELLVHLTTTQSRAKRYLLAEVKIPSRHLETLSPAELLQGWNRSPPTLESMEVGDRWIAEGRSLCLRVPSAIIPEGHNLLLNVDHPEFANIRSGSLRPFHYDSRI